MDDRSKSAPSKPTFAKDLQLAGEERLQLEVGEEESGVSGSFVLPHGSHRVGFGGPASVGEVQWSLDHVLQRIRLVFKHLDFACVETRTRLRRSVKNWRQCRPGVKDPYVNRKRWNYSSTRASTHDTQKRNNGRCITFKRKKKRKTKVVFFSRILLSEPSGTSELLKANTMRSTAQLTSVCQQCGCHTKEKKKNPNRRLIRHFLSSIKKQNWTDHTTNKQTKEHLCVCSLCVSCSLVKTRANGDNEKCPASKQWGSLTDWRVFSQRDFSAGQSKVYFADVKAELEGGPADDEERLGTVTLGRWRIPGALLVAAGRGGDPAVRHLDPHLPRLVPAGPKDDGSIQAGQSADLALVVLDCQDVGQCGRLHGGSIWRKETKSVKRLSNVGRDWNDPQTDENPCWIRSTDFINEPDRRFLQRNFWMAQFIERCTDQGFDWVHWTRHFLCVANCIPVKGALSGPELHNLIKQEDVSSFLARKLGNLVKTNGGLVYIFLDYSPIIGTKLGGRIVEGSPAARTNPASIPPRMKIHHNDFISHSCCSTGFVSRCVGELPLRMKRMRLRQNPDRSIIFFAPPDEMMMTSLKNKESHKKRYSDSLPLSLCVCKMQRFSGLYVSRGRGDEKRSAPQPPTGNSGSGSILRPSSQHPRRMRARSLVPPIYRSLGSRTTCCCALSIHTIY